MRTLDAFLPSYEFSERHAVSVDAPPARVDRAVREVTLAELPVVRALFALRGLPRRQGDVPVLTVFGGSTTVLEDVPGEGLVLELRGQFWRLRGGRGEPSATAVVDFRTDHAGILSTETRVHVADAGARRKFARYWRVIRPFSGLIRIRMLRAAKRRAEAAA
ncbi:MAG: hypothetical protein QOE36_1121 [Gaiellaceae bacterium]|nr:hypothetical protein [Gaiellaceae bacterium]